MKFNSKLILILYATITTTFASVGDKCSGRMVFVSVLVPVVVMEVKFTPENALMIQVILNVVIIFFVQPMMEEEEIVYLVINVMVKFFTENVPVVVISNVV